MSEKKSVDSLQFQLPELDEPAEKKSSVLFYLWLAVGVFWIFGGVAILRWFPWSDGFDALAFVVVCICVGMFHWSIFLWCAVRGL